MGVVADGRTGTRKGGHDKEGGWFPGAPQERHADQRAERRRQGADMREGLFPCGIHPADGHEDEGAFHEPDLQLPILLV
ncbi:MAG: hypothetical protein HC841_05400 [Verrucomicrobiae bacterium]|nr:hypothetical protein [Verrucomicrobiae bacterium]